MVTSVYREPDQSLHQLNFRYGWFRQNESERCIYGFYSNDLNGMRDYLLMNFNYKTGDYVSFPGYVGNGYPSVTLADSVKFGNRYLKRIKVDRPWTNTQEMVQGRDIFVSQQTIHYHNISKEYWSKFVYKTDTLTTFY